MKKLLTLVTITTLGLASVQAESRPEVTVEQVRQAVQGWCDALLRIARAESEGKDPKQVAEEILSQAYDYDNGKVLFKPTLTFGEQTFRLDKEGALAYFVGGNPNFPNDSGFALKGWTNAKFDVADIIVHEDIGIFMGNVFLTNADNEETKVNKTFVFRFRDDGTPVIIVHKSALPFTPST